MRYAARILCKSPVFTVSAILTLALGIGANTAIFTLIDALMLKSLPVPEPERLVQLAIHNDELQTVFCYPELEQIQQRARSFVGMFTWNATDFSMGWGVDARHIAGAVASGQVYRTLGIRAQAGRLFTPEDDTLSAANTAVISDRFWETEFHRDPRAIGQRLLLDRQPFTIIGVTPRNFFGVSVGNSPDVTIPIHANAALHPKRDILHTTRVWWLSILARLKPDVSEGQARAELRAISPLVMSNVTNPGGSPEERRQFLAQTLDAIPGAVGNTFLTQRYRQPLFVLIAVSGMVLLVACVNLASLLLARAAARSKEMSIRLALGAGRPRLIRQSITESMLLSLTGALVGAVFAVWATRFGLTFLNLTVDLSPDFRVLCFLSALAIATGLLFGAAPAIQGTDLHANDALKQGRIGLSSRRWGLGKALVAAQVALSLVLMLGAFLFIRTFENLKSQPTGFERDNLVFIDLDSERSGMQPEQLARFYDDVLRQTRALPFVRSASLTGVVPMTGAYSYDELSPDLWPSLGRARRTLYMHRVAPDYFRTTGTAILQGRDFTRADAAVTKEKLAILNERAARTYFPGQSAVGQLLRVRQDDVYRIIGIAGDAKYATLRGAAPRTIYLNAMRGTGIVNNPMMFGNSWNLVVRTSKDAGPVLSAVRSLVRETGKDVVITGAVPVNELIYRALMTERLVAVLASFFAALAAVLVAIGLYGMLGYTVARRTSEIGVRLALGAAARDVLWMVLKEALLLSGIGVAIGIPAALACGRVVSSLLFEIRPGDPITIAITVVSMLLISAVAGFFPAWRASKLDPMAALRWE